MCGILGFSGKGKFDTNKIKTLSLCNSYERGGDASGYYSPESGIVKDIKKAHELMLDGTKKQVLPSNLLIGHFRKMSVGSNTEKNTHPFQFNDIVGCHNGTLNNHARLATAHGIPSGDWFTDSHVLLNILSIQYKEEKPLDILNDYFGSAALLFTDVRSNELFAYRDSQRPLHYGFSDEGMYISSLDYSLQIIGCTDIKEFEADKIYKIFNGKIIEVKDKPEKKIEIVSTVDYPIAYEGDIVYRSYYGGTTSNQFKNNYLFRANKIFTGIHPSDVRGLHLIGYNVAYTGMTTRAKETQVENPKVGTFTKGKYYLIQDYQVSSGCVQVLDDEGAEKLLSIKDLDTTNFIPYPGRYVKLRNNLKSETTGESVGRKGDLFLVNDYHYGSPNVTVKDPIKGQLWTIPVRFIETISKNQSDAHHVFVTEVMKDRVSTVKIIESDDEDVSDNDESADQNIDFNVLIGLLMILSDKLQTISDDYEVGADIKDKLIDLSEYIDNCYESNFVLKEVNDDNG